jgi:dUTP pyrophosphatase
MSKIKIAKLYEGAVLPTRKNFTDAGLDLYAFVENKGYSFIAPNSMGIVRTGITIEIPKGYFGLIKPKSKSNFLVGAGVVDESYQGELLVKLFSYTGYTLVTGDPIAQLLIIPCITPEVEEVSTNDIHQVKTMRGKTGGIVSDLNYKEG